MSRKTAVMIGMIAGSTVGGYAPALFGAGVISLAGLLGSTVGGLLGIYVAWRLTE